MSETDPYAIILHRHVTEKTKMLESLKKKENNPCIRKCTSPKYVFMVSMQANKKQIASAIETIYPDITVKNVHTLCSKPKRRRVRGRVGFTKKTKKAIVTLASGDTFGDEEE